MFRFTSPPRTDFSVSDTPNNRSYKTFVRSLYTFYFRQCFTVSFKFSSSLLFHFFSQFNSFFRFIKMKILGNFQSVFTSMVDTYPNCKDVQSAIGHTITEIFFCLHMAYHLFFIVRINAHYRNSILVLFVGSLFHAFQTLANQWLPNYHMNMISYSKLSLAAFFSQDWPLDTPWGQLHYTLTP